MRFAHTQTRLGCIVKRQAEISRRSAVIGNIVAVVVLLATVAAAVYVAGNWSEATSGIREEIEQIPALQASVQQQAAAGSESTLVIVTDGSERIGSISLLAAADDDGGSLTVIPSSLFELLPGYGDFPLRDAMLFEGSELAGLAVSNALGIRVDRVVALGPGELAAALAEPMQLELTEPVLVAQGDTLVQLADVGSGLFDGRLVERLLLEQGESAPVSWVERQSAIWTSLLERTASDPTFASRLLGDGSSAATLRRVAANTSRVSLLPVTPVAVAGAEDGFQSSQADISEFVANTLGHLALETGERPRVEVLNGNGRILATRSVVAALVATGFHVVKTDNAENFDFEETVVISQGRDNIDAAKLAVATLGVQVLQLEVAAPSGVVDVSIIVGQDIATLRS